MGIIYALIAFVFVIGLCIGSFLNVVILRSLSEESIVFPPSKCPKCLNKLKWWHNIPVLSYILLGGKCGFCKERISIQYPIIELLTGLIFVFEFLKFGISIDTIFIWIVSALLIVIAGTDIKEKVVFDAHTYSLIGVGIFYSLLIFGISLYLNITNDTFVLNKEMLLHNPLTTSILGIITGVLIMEILARAGYVFAGTRAFGEGDTYIAAGLGAFLGWKSTIIVLLGSIIVQMIFTLPIFIKKLINSNDKVTLISLICFAGYTVLFFALQQAGLFNDGIILYIIGAIILAAIGLFLCYRILKGLKQDQENLTYLPFGPAMVISALIFMLI
ncbi:prepilin peptidase [bacterium]|nr:prepilin peptidase [bacterium]